MTREHAIAALVALGLGVSAGVLYAPTTDFPFVSFGDGARLLENPSIRSGLAWENLRFAFTSRWEANWSPVTWISHMLDFTFYGTDAGGHHLTNRLLHALNAMLLFGALRSATGDTFRPAAVGMLLALHPIHVESVAWVSARQGLLSASFGFASLWSYCAHARGGHPRARALAVVFLTLGLMAKPMLVSLPFLFLLFDHWPLKRSQRSLSSLVSAKWPYFAVVLASVAITLFAWQEIAELRPFEVLPILPRLANAIVSTLLYLEKLGWPRGLAVFYPHPNLPGGAPSTAFEVAGAAGLLAVLAIVAWRARHPAPRVGLAWYVIALLPVLGLLQVGTQAMADRYAYLPAVGIYLAVVYGLADLLHDRSPALRTAAIVAFCALLVPLVLASRQQLEVWRTSEALYRHATEVTRANYSMHFNLANTLKGRGRIEEALAEYQKAIEIWPGMERAHFNLANTLVAENRLDEAIEHYRAAVEAQPDSLRARDTLGRILVRKGDLPGAIAHYREEASLRPRSLRVHVSLARLLRLAGEFEEAIRLYEIAARLDPGDGRWEREAEAMRAEQRDRAAGQPGRN